MKNNYSSFMTIEEMQQQLKKISSKNDITKGGIPLCYDDNALYLDEDYGHVIVIGSTGSGKTQSVTYPKLYTSIKASENIIVDDPKGEDLETFKDDLINNGYKIFKFDLKDFMGNKWNPIKLAFDLYKEDNLDDTVMILEKIAYYLFTTSSNDNSDPFWINCTRSLFVGTILYIFEKEDRLPTIKEVSNFATKITGDDFNELSDDSPAKIFLRVIMTAPKDTMGSIFSVFNNLIMCYSYANKLNDFLSETDFDLSEFTKEKRALFIIDGHKKSYVTNLISLFIEELYYICNRERNKTKINIILDDFDSFDPIDNLPKLLMDTRSNIMEFTLLTNSLHKLSELYGEINLEHIIAYFNKIIYLFANDEYTLEYISNICGNKNVNEKLISTTELKLLTNFEAIVLKMRKLPFRTKLLPFYMYKAK